jgi:hypothetical protein
MSADTQIPEDVMKAVQSAWEKAWSKTGSTNAESIREAIAIAILAERERCASIAGYYAQACLETESDGSGYYACNSLFDEIRNPTPPKPPMPAINDNDLPF